MNRSHYSVCAADEHWSGWQTATAGAMVQHIARSSKEGIRTMAARALEFINQVLARPPMSTTALSMRAEILAPKGACRDAAADWQQAAQALRGGLDVSNKRLAAPAEIDEDRERTAMYWQKRAETSNCP